MVYLLETLLDQDPGSIMHRVLDMNLLKSPHDIVSMAETTFDHLTYLSEDGKSELTIPRGGVGLLTAFKRFVLFQEYRGTPIQDDEWVTIDPDDFNNFRISTDFTFHIPSTLSTGSRPTFSMSGPSIDIVRDFRRGIKRDASQFSPLRDDGAWDSWHRTTVAQARAQDVSEVLDGTHNPATQDEQDLFDEKQKYMFAVFEKTLLTDKGKALVRAHQRKYDAQRIFSELSAYALQSTKASMDASSLLSYITTTRLGDGQWKGTTHAFILHWQDQVRKYHDLCGNQQLPEALVRTMLENAVHSINELRIIKTQAEQHKTHSGASLTYSQYTALLLSAAQQHDKVLSKPASQRPQRNVYRHDVAYGEPLDDATAYTIDSTIESISAFNAVSTPPAYTRMTRDQWYKLTDDAKHTWDQLSDDAKSIILTPRTSGPRPGPTPLGSSRPPLPRRRVNAHDLGHLLDCLHPFPASDTSLVTACLHDHSEGRSSGPEFTYDQEANNEPPSSSVDTQEDQLLAHMTNRKNLPPGSLQRLLSPSANGSGKASVPNPKPTSSQTPPNVKLTFMVPFTEPLMLLV